MPSHRHRSYSRDRSRSPSRDRSRSRSPERSVPLPNGVEPISESDYFLKSDEFRVWLKDEKRKYLDELTSDKSRKYFRKFVRAWNRGKLPKSLYSDIDIIYQPASSQTGYKWSFTSKTSRADNEALRAARDDVGAATYNRPALSERKVASKSGRVLGPTLPSQSDLTLIRETVEEERTAERSAQRRRDRREGKERVEEMVGPKEVGREGLLEKKRVQRETDRAFRERGDEGLEVDDSTLMGGGDSFKQRIAKRDAARERFQEKRFGARDERVSAARERADAIRQKDKATMDMFMQMAKNKFG